MKIIPKRLKKIFSDKSIKFWLGFIFLIFGTSYLFMVPTANVGLADSDELLGLAYFLGVGHPPGYPIYLFLLHGNTRYHNPIHYICFLILSLSYLGVCEISNIESVYL